jgi:ATP-dependent helicase HrpB
MLLAAPEPDRLTAARLAALLSERDVLRREGYGQPTTADVATRLAVLGRERRDGDGANSHPVDRAAAATVRRRADELVRRVERAVPARKAATPATPADPADRDPGPLLAEAYPDRIAQARGGGRYRLRHGGGAVLPDHDPLAAAGWLVAAEVERPGGWRRPG